jgi:histidinol phosphatase-like enzyme (inositol monophosphatase family)
VGAPLMLIRSKLSPSDMAALVAALHHLADLARPVTLRYFRSPDLRADNKLSTGFDPVTQADRETETILRAWLSEHRPKDGILAEEFENQPSHSGLTWVIDPIDGTRAYLSGTPCWGVLIAVADVQGPFLGVIDQPYTGERFIGGPGLAQMTGPHGTTPLSSKATQALSDAILFTTFPEIGTPEERARFQNVARNVKLVRYGMDCYAYGLLALGTIDLVIEAGLSAYDIAAPMAVIEAAGGVVTDWQGNPVGATGQVIAAANPVLHGQALALLNA